MTFDAFVRSLARPAAPPDLDPPLRALWLDRKGDWEGAHALAGDIDGATGARIHAYLHRKEGDLPNARYWYDRAHVAPARSSLDDEWEQLARQLVATPPAP